MSNADIVIFSAAFAGLAFVVAPIIVAVLICWLRPKPRTDRMAVGE